MEKIINQSFQETYYRKVLDNGLTVVLFEKPDFHNNFFTLITPYGAGDYRQKDAFGNKYHLPPGVAHFLEHRMFDYQGFDVMEKLVEQGSTSNASTGFDQTQYYFGTTKDDYYPSLDLLLNFVFDLTIPEETVEKEKGIIIEELKMYDGMPDFKLYFGILKNMYHYLPYNEDIGGSVKSVSETTLEDLNLAYKLNYHPAQMYLVGAINGDIEATFNFIEDNLKSKQFDEYVKLERDFEAEPETVAVAFTEESMEVSKQKIALGYKFKHNETDPEKIDQMENLLHIYFEMLFSSVNEDYQKWLDEKIINDYFDVDVTVENTFGHLVASGEHDDVEVFKNFVESVIDNQDKYVSEAKFKQLQKKLIGKAILSLEQPSTIAQVYGRNIAEQIDVFESLDKFKTLTLNDLLELVGKLDLRTNSSVYTIIPK